MKKKTKPKEDDDLGRVKQPAGRAKPRTQAVSGDPPSTKYHISLPNHSPVKCYQGKVMTKRLKPIIHQAPLTHKIRKKNVWQYSTKQNL